MFSTRTLISFLGWLVCFSISISADAENHFRKAMTPLSTTYHHEVLKEVRARQPKVNVLRNHPLLFGSTFFNASVDHIAPQFALGGTICYPFMMLATGVAIPTEHIINDIEGFKENLEGTRLSDFRVSLVIGHLYKYAAYLRTGYDYTPFGRHASEAIVSQSVITRSKLLAKNIIVEAGNNHRTLSAELQYSLACCLSPAEMVIFKVQYGTKTPVQIGNFNIIENYTVGGGLGAGDGEAANWRLPPHLGFLLNCYGDVGFKQYYNLRFEYLYNDVYSHIQSNDHSKHTSFSPSPHNLHIEGSKHFPQLAMALHTPSAIIVGYERGIRVLASRLNHDDMKSAHNLFLAFKLGLWKQYVTLLGGGQLNFPSKKPESFFRIGVSL